MRRLYLQIYLLIIAILVVVAIALGVLWRVVAAEQIEETIEHVSEFAARLPDARAPAVVQQRAIDRLHARLRTDLALYAPDGAFIAGAGRNPPPLRPDRHMGPGFMMGPGGPSWSLRLDDGRWLVTRVRGRRPGIWLVLTLGLIGLGVAVGVYPLARFLTRRLERLQAGVEQFGRGDLSVRVPVEGKDEVASLGESFNRAATRIEDLVRSHKMLLANASHELRTPLARITMALALAEKEIDAERRAHLKADLAELNVLIDEILLASRLDAVRAPERTEDVDVLALAAEEGARYDAHVQGEAAATRGDPSLLRRMIRNLLENAVRHGGGSAPEVTVRRGKGQLMVEVRDHGPGVPAAERERIFAPFYRLAGAAETGRGSGLGLALVRQIAQSHGGNVEYVAPEAGGSCFRVTLPTA